jgi:hypothetical protein
MPSNVTVKRPYSRVIRIKLHYEIVSRRQDGCISSLWVFRIYGRGRVTRIVDPNAEGQYVHVVAVEMHGMVEGNVVLENDADGTVAAEVIGIPLRVERVGDIPFVGGEEKRIVIITPKGLSL